MWRATKRLLKEQSIIPTIKMNNTSFASDSDKCKVFTERLSNVFKTNNTDISSDNFINKINREIAENFPPYPDEIAPVDPKEIKL